MTKIGLLLRFLPICETSIWGCTRIYQTVSEHAFSEAYPFCKILRRSVDQTFRSPEPRARVGVIETPSTEKERSNMGPQSRLVAGILLILVPTVEVGGVSILS